MEAPRDKYYDLPLYGMDKLMEVSNNPVSKNNKLIDLVENLREENRLLKQEKHPPHITALVQENKNLKDKYEALETRYNILKKAYEAYKRLYPKQEFKLFKNKLWKF